MGNTPSPLLASSQPRYLMLAQSLMDDISAGRYPVGDLIPTELELCKQFNVSRHTVREAIRRLCDMGLVTRQAGVGTRVQAVQPASRYGNTSEGVSDLFQRVRDIRLVITEREEIVADEKLTELLECKPGQVWQHIHGGRFHEDGTSLASITDIYIPLAYRSAIGDQTHPEIPIYEMIEQKYGVAVAEVVQQVSATLITGDQSEKLKVESGSTGLFVVRKYLSAKGDILEVAVNLYPGEKFSYSSRLRMEPKGNDPEQT